MGSAKDPTTMTKRRYSSPQPLTDAEIKSLIERHRIPVLDFGKFARSLRADFEIYAKDRCCPNNNQLYNEIEELHRAAERGDAGLTIKLFCKLSPQAREILERRAQRRPALFSLDTAEPSKIAALCRTGGTWTDDRKRPYDVQLYAPEKTPTFAKRESERMFVINLQLTWLIATGSPPSTTASAERKGPFVRFVEECLGIAGAPHANAVKTINKIAEHRRARRPRQEKTSMSPIKG